MRAASLVLLAVAALPAADKAERPVDRASLVAVERVIDARLVRLFGVDNPVDLMGKTQSTYLAKCGAVFIVELNVSPAAGLSPFRPAVSAQEVAKVKQKKLDRLPVLKQNMKTLLIDAAAALDSVPPNEQVVLGVTLFYLHWEDNKGLPSQVVMRGQRSALVDLKLGRGSDAAIQIQEF